MANKGGRKPRKPRSESARMSTQRANTEGKARRDLRAKYVALESRMTLLERLVESINTPMAQSIADEARTVRDLLEMEQAAGSEEDFELFSGTLPEEE